jgi:MFS family permease
MTSQAVGTVADARPELDTVELPDGARRRSVGALFAGVALMHTALIAASAVATLVAADAVGSAWGGVPNAAAVVGTAIGAMSVAALMTRWGRRAALLLGYALAAVGALVAAAAALVGAVPLLAAAMIFVGVGNGTAQMSRYAAADMYPVARRGYALGVIVWAGTVGAVIGPSLISPATSAARALHLTPLAGPFLAALVAMLGAGLALALMPRGGLGRTASGTRSTEVLRLRPADHNAAVRFLRLARLPVVRVPLTAMLSAQLAMVAIMTMTPLHIHLHGHGLATTGGVLTAHSLGMFVLSPLSGRLTDRLGGRVAIVCGLVTLAVAALFTLLAPPSDTAILTVGLFLLGFGWNLSFVGGSGLLSTALPPAERTGVQAAVEALVWGSSAIASLASGWLFAVGGYTALAIVGGSLTIFPAAIMARERGSIRPSLERRSMTEGQFCEAIEEPGRV